MLHSKVSVPHQYLNPTKAHYKSNQGQMLHSMVWLRARAVTCRLRIIRAKAKASSPTHPLLLAVSYKVPKVPKSPLLLAGSKVPKWHRLCGPNGHPLGLNPAGVLLFRMGAHAGPLRAVCGWGPKGQSFQPQPFADEVQKAKASSLTHPLLVAGSKVPKVSKSLLL